MDFIYTVDPLAKVPIMLLNDDIGYDPTTGKGIDGAKFMSELMALDAMKPDSIQVWINSPGGVVMDGYNIYSAILRTQTKVDTVGVGCMASIAAVIFQAGRTRTMMDFSWLMYHNPFGGDDPKALQIMKDSISKMVARSGKTEDDILAMMKKETYITAQEALAYGMCDKIEDSADHNKKRLSSFTETTAFHKEANKILNKLIDTKTTVKMKLVTNKLNLQADASEDSILASIVAIENKAKDEKKALEDKLAKLQKAKDDIDEEMDALKKEKDALSKEKDSLAADKTKMETEVMDLKKEKADAEDAMNTEKCKNMISGFVQAGRIKDDAKTVDFWTGLAKVDFDMTKEQIENLPLTKKAPVINKIEGDRPALSVGIVMAQIAAKYNSKNNN